MSCITEVLKEEPVIRDVFVCFISDGQFYRLHGEVRF
jgi:hypothetical protein